MIAVLVESPYAGNVERNLAYLRACLRDCLQRDEAPFASHAIYTQPGVLDDSDPAERARGIEAGLFIGARMDKTVVYEDLGLTPGMQLGIERARLAGRPVEFRALGEVVMSRKITLTEGVMGGQPCIEGTRVPTSIIGERFADGESIGSIADDYGFAQAEVVIALRFEMHCLYAKGRQRGVQDTLARIEECVAAIRNRVGA